MRAEIHCMTGCMRASFLRQTLPILLALCVAAPAAAAPPRDTREMQAREAFAAGRYQDALDMYVKLYAEKLRPLLLRMHGIDEQTIEDQPAGVRPPKPAALDPRDRGLGGAQRHGVELVERRAPARSRALPEPRR